MARKDYYLILGVTPEENVHGIRDAFRELAKTHHPDRAGPDETATFQDIQEAYEVLSHPDKRRMYNQERDRSQGSAYAPQAISARRHWRPEPLVPEPMSVLHGFGTIQPSAESLYERFLRNFTGRGVPKGERLEALNVEVMLSPEEAATGGALAVGVPVFFICPECSGTGRDWLFPCLDCNAQGVIARERPVRVYIPPAARDRSIAEAPIYALGVRNFYLRLHVRLS